jgi:hypothetical protein
MLHTYKEESFSKYQYTVLQFKVIQNKCSVIMQEAYSTGLDNTGALMLMLMFL